MDIQTKKIEFIQRFLKIDNEKVIIYLEKVLENQESKMINPDLISFTVEELNKRIDQSIADSKNNRVTKHEDLVYEIKT